VHLAASRLLEYNCLQSAQEGSWSAPGIDGEIADLMNKGYAFGFLIVLLVLILGLYVAYTGFVSSREALLAQPTSPASARAEQATRPAASASATPTPAVAAILTPTQELTITVAVATLTSEPQPSAAAPTKQAAPPPTRQPPPPPTETPLPQVQPPTPLPVPAYQFRLAGPPRGDPAYPNCCYIFGTVRDAAGNGLEGIQVQALNEWNTLPPALTKGGGELGQYNIPIGRDMVTWDLIIVDAGGTQISTKAQVQFDPNVANGFRVDWQRTY
jgi:hypothetical protein